VSLYPNIALLLVGNEENGEAEEWGTPHVLKELGLTPSLFIAGERTGEKGDELFGEVCVENRGVMRFDVIARGAKGHSGVAGTGDLSEKLIAARSALNEIFAKHLTLKSSDGWQSQAKFPFISVGTPGSTTSRQARGFWVWRFVPSRRMMSKVCGLRSSRIAKPTDLKSISPSWRMAWRATRIIQR
jgi:acetylornithine deacetylase/succinyl-diaminopimelate desuccinylase-like protein